MPDPIASIGGDDFLSGVFPDLPQTQKPLFSDSGNVLFTERGVRAMPGQNTLIQPQVASPVRGLIATRISGTETIFFGYIDSLYKWTESGGASSVGSGYSGILNQTSTQLATFWSMTRWGDWILATNGVDAPVIFKSSSFATLTTSSTFSTAEIFLTWRDYVLAFNTDNVDTEIRWCHSGDPEDWAVAANKTAGALNARDSDSEIKAAIVNGGNIFFTTGNQLHVVEFLNAPFYFGTRKLLDGIGSLGKHAICSAKGLLYGFSHRGIWRSDGASYEYIDTPAVRRYIFEDINSNQLSKAHCWHDLQDSSVTFYFPAESSSEPDKGLAFNYRDQNWAKITYGRSVAEDSGVFSVALLGSITGAILQQDIEGVPGAGVSIQSHPITEGTVTLELPFGGGAFGDGAFGGSTTL